MSTRRRRFKVALPIDPEDAKRMLADPHAGYAKTLLAERERRFDANLLAAINDLPAPYPLPEEMFDYNICSECGQEINKETT
jgi:hypothetical protein